MTPSERLPEHATRSVAAQTLRHPSVAPPTLRILVPRRGVGRAPTGAWRGNPLIATSAGAWTAGTQPLVCKQNAPRGFPPGGDQPGRSWGDVERSRDTVKWRILRDG